MISCSCVKNITPSSLWTVFILVFSPQLRVQRDTHKHRILQQEAFIFLGVKNVQVTMSLHSSTTSPLKLELWRKRCLLSVRICFSKLLGRGLRWLKTKQNLCHEVSWKRPWYIFQFQDGFHGAPGSLHDWHQAIVGVLLNFHIWEFNSLQHKNSSTSVLEIMYLFTTAHQWALFYERLCVLSLIFTTKHLCTQ